MRGMEEGKRRWEGLEEDDRLGGELRIGKGEKGEGGEYWEEEQKEKESIV